MPCMISTEQQRTQQGNDKQHERRKGVEQDCIERHPPGAPARSTPRLTAPARHRSELRECSSGTTLHQRSSHGGTGRRSQLHSLPHSRSQALDAAPQCKKCGPGKAPSSGCLSISFASCVSRAAAPASWPPPKGTGG